MKKFLLFIVVALAFIVVGVPYYEGREVEGIYREHINLFNKNASTSIKILSYERGIWTSKAVTEVPIGFITLKFQHQISHGPLVIGSQSEGSKRFFSMAVIRSVPDFSGSYFSDIREAFGDRDPFSWKTFIAFNGSSETFFYSPSLEYKKDTGETISWKGFEGQFSTDEHFNAIKGHLTFPGISAITSMFSGEIQGVNFQFDQKRSTNLDFWVGKMLVGIDKILVNAQEKSIEVSSLKLDGETDNENQLFNILWTLDLTKAIVPSGTYGPAQILVKLMNMDPEGFKLLHDLPKGKVVKQDVPKPVIKQILSKGPTLVVENTKLTLPEGNVVLNAKFTVGGSNIPDAFDESIYLSTLEGELTAEFPKELVDQGLRQTIQQSLSEDPQYNSITVVQQKAEVERQLKDKLNKFKNSGILNEKGDQYLIKFSVMKGKIVVNDKEVPISSLI